MNELIIVIIVMGAILCASFCYAIFAAILDKYKQHKEYKGRILNEDTQSIWLASIGDGNDTP